MPRINKAKAQKKAALGIKQTGNITQEIIKSGGNVIEWATKRG